MIATGMTTPMAALAPVDIPPEETAMTVGEAGEVEMGIMLPDPVEVMDCGPVVEASASKRMMSRSLFCHKIGIASQSADVLFCMTKL
jgi:hypothetical protein